MVKVTRKDWVAKLHQSHGLPKVVKIKPNQEKRWGKGTILIPAPIEVDQVMRKVPKGKLVTVNQIRENLAEKHRATICCPLTTGIFASISAQAAEQEKAEGKEEITPYWRTLKMEGELNPKYPGGVERQKKRLEAEGHQVIEKGKKSLVKNFAQSLITL